MTRRVILQEFVSIDGLASGPNDDVSFVPASNQGDQGFGRHQVEFIDSIDLLVLGRRTYTMFAGFWPKVTSGDEKEFADKVNATPKVVFSRTLDRAPWGDWEEARIVKSDPAAEVARLKGLPGKDLLIWGSLSIAQLLRAAGLIDEYQLLVCPVLLGSGRPVFGDAAGMSRMRLLRTQSFDRGTALLAYAPGTG